MAEFAASIVISAVDRLTRPARRIAASVDRVTRANKRLDDGMAQGNRRLDERRRHLENVRRSTERLGKARERAQRVMLGAGGAAVAGFGIRRAGQALLRPLLGSLGEASQRRDFETSLGVLLGGATEARKRMEELTRFGATTPFELPGIVRASITLETLTQGAFSTGEGLRLVGDVAAGVNQPIEELSMWFGRLYDGIRSGRPVGEAMMRFQELGIISGETRNRIEEMQKAGADGDKIWAVATKAFGRFSGMMDQRSRELSGLWSNLVDQWSNLRAAIGKPLIPVVKPLISGLTKVLGIVTSLLERFPWLAGIIGAATGALAVMTIGVGALVTAGGVLVGSLAAVSFGMEWLSVKTRLANSRMLAFHGTNLMTSKGLLITAGAAKARFLAATKWAWALAGGAIPGIIGAVKALGAAILAIPGIGPIVAAVAVIAAAIYTFWNPIKAFFVGWMEGFLEALAPVWDAFRPFIDFAQWLGPKVMSIIGMGPPELEKMSGAAAKVGRVMGTVFGTVVRTLTAPFRLLVAIGETVGDLVSLFTGLIKPVEVLANLWDRIKGFFGFGGGKDKRSPSAAAERATSPARRARRVVAAGTLAAAPAFASPADTGAVTSPDPIVRSVRGGDVMNVTAPVTVNVPPGVDSREVGREVERAVRRAMREADTRRRAEKRRNLYG